MNHQQNLQELLEACRDDDIRDPEMSALAERMEADSALREQYERVQECDRAIAAAFGKVDVPPGLAERLFAAVDAQTAAEEAAPLEEGLSEKPIEPSVGRPARRAKSNRAWRLSAGILTAAVLALCAVGVWLSWPQDDPVSGEQLAQQANGWVEQAIDPAAQWSTEPPPEQYPVDQAILSPVRGWRPFPLPYDRNAVVYKLNPPGREYVLLFVAAPSREFAVAQLPVGEITSTGAWSLGAWERSERLYVLAVEGDSDRLRQQVKVRMASRSQSHLPVACISGG